MKLLVIVALCAVGALALEESEYRWHFENFRSEHNKQYESAEVAQARFAVFKENLDYINKHNAGDHTFTLAVNKFADQTNEEWSAGMKMCRKSLPKSTNVSASLRVSAPDAVDWTTKGAVTPVKNQGQCGSCWAFSTTGSTEGRYEIAKGQLISLSEQQLVDCGAAEGSHGCEGGLMDFGFQYIIDNGGLCTEQAYPYEARDDSCRAGSCTPAVKISSFQDVAQMNEDALKTAVADGPVSVAIEADQSCFQFYSGGVMTDSGCGTQLDHGVLVVGYGTDNGQDYWKVKNSWGASWGEAGYIRLGRGSGSGKAGECGIASQPSYPVV
jgi:C1A family cysteine protease